jgi:hypothetical protein
MRCRECHWPVSFWARDPIFGTCAECKKIAIADPKLDRKAAVREALLAHGEASLKRGTPPAELGKQMEAVGLSAEETNEIVNEAIKRRAPFLRAMELLEGGASRVETNRQLRESGVDPGLAEWVIEEAQRTRAGEVTSSENRISKLVVFGLIVFGFGILVGIIPLLETRIIGFLISVAGLVFMRIGRSTR